MEIGYGDGSGSKNMYNGSCGISGVEPQEHGRQGSVEMLGFKD
jgi:hypothetical protein